MRPIIIGAGRGRRLNALTDGQPKCYVPIGGRRILDWMLEALAAAGLETPVFVGGYRIEQIEADYPHLTYCHNADWQHNNILASLFCAEEYMADGFVCSYADILYRPTVVRRALEHEGDIALCVDTDWRTRYADRSQHPEDDAEKIVAAGRSGPGGQPRHSCASGQRRVHRRGAVQCGGRTVFAGALSADEGGVRRADLEGRHAIRKGLSDSSLPRNAGRRIGLAHGDHRWRVYGN